MSKEVDPSRIFALRAEVRAGRGTGHFDRQGSAVVAGLAEAIADVGLGEKDRDLRKLAGALREVGLGD